MSDFVTIFTTRSPVEADVVRGLLEANGLMPVVSSATRSILPFSIGELGEVRINVHSDEADEARRIIDQMGIFVCTHPPPTLKPIQQPIRTRRHKMHTILD